MGNALKTSYFTPDKYYDNFRYIQYEQHIIMVLGTFYGQSQLKYGVS